MNLKRTPSPLHGYFGQRRGGVRAHATIPARPNPQLRAPPVASLGTAGFALLAQQQGDKRTADPEALGYRRFASTSFATGSGHADAQIKGMGLHLNLYEPYLKQLNGSRNRYIKPIATTLTSTAKQARLCRDGNMIFAEYIQELAQIVKIEDLSQLN